MPTRTAARAAPLPHTHVMALPSDPTELERAMRGVLVRRTMREINDRKRWHDFAEAKRGIIDDDALANADNFLRGEGQ